MVLTPFTILVACILISLLNFAVLYVHGVLCCNYMVYVGVCASS